VTWHLFRCQKGDLGDGGWLLTWAGHDIVSIRRCGTFVACCIVVVASHRSGGGPRSSLTSQPVSFIVVVVAVGGDNGVRRCCQWVVAVGKVINDGGGWKPTFVIVDDAKSSVGVRRGSIWARLYNNRIYCDQFILFKRSYGVAVGVLS
jgi:hypothetical protein